MSFSSDHTTLYYLLKLFTSENLTVRKGDPLPPFWCYVSNANAVMHSGENSHMWKRLICCSAIGWYSTEAGISNCSVQPLSVLRCALVRTLDYFSCDLAQSLQKYSRIMCSRKRKLILSLFTFWKEDLFMLKDRVLETSEASFVIKKRAATCLLILSRRVAGILLAYFITIYLPSIPIPQVILQWFYIYSSLLIFTFSKLRQKVTKPACSYRLFLREISLFIYTA